MVGGCLSVYLGAPWHLLHINVLSCCLHNPVRTLFPHQPQGQGWPGEVQSKVTFLLTLTGGCTEGDRMFGLSTMGVHPYQARAPTIEEAVKQLTPLPSTGSDCPYALVQLNGDTCHVPHPREGHLSIQVKGVPAEAPVEEVSQLQVLQLLSLGSQVVYLVELNGCEVPVIASPPESLAKGISLLRDEPIYLKVDIPQSIVEGPELKAQPLSSHSPSNLIASPIQPPLP